jgi:hypothetical protein
MRAFAVFVMTMTILAGAGTPSAVAAAPYAKRIELSATGVAPSAAGKARLFESDTREIIDVSAYGLSGSSGYRFFVDGSEIVSFTTTPDGALTFRISRNPTGNDLPLPASVQVSTVSSLEIRDASGAIVLQGSTNL